MMKTSTGNTAGRDTLRENLSNLFKWLEDWQMTFTLEKCELMHIGNKRNSFDNYASRRKIFKQVNEEHYLIFNYKFKVDKQCIKVVKKAKQVL